MKLLRSGEVDEAFILHGVDCNMLVGRLEPTQRLLKASTLRLFRRVSSLRRVASLF